jgi:soluble lytic murein transglycosylase-like protein
MSGVALAVTLANGGSARGQVMEIQPDGAVITYAGPAQYIDGHVRPLGLGPPAAARGAAPADVADAIAQSAARHNLPRTLLEAVAWQESRFDQRAHSRKGARGVMQLLPDTARSLNVDAGNLTSNIEGGAAYLVQLLRRFGDLRLALAAYNSGPDAVTRYGGIPPFAETRAYVDAVIGRLGAAPDMSKLLGEIG